MAPKAAGEEAPAPKGLLATYPIPLTPDAPKGHAVDLFNARKLIAGLHREAAQERRNAPPENETPEEKALRDRAECSAALAKCFQAATQHVPGGVMNKVSTFTYMTPNGPKSISRSSVEATLKEAQRPYITDLLEGSSVDPGDKPGDSSSDGSDDDDGAASASGLRYMRVDAAEVLAGYTYGELDEMRFALVAAADLISRGVFDARGGLSGLAKRDIRKAWAAAGGVEAKPKEAPKPVVQPVASGPPQRRGKGGSGIITAPKTAKEEDKPQRNLKPLLFDMCLKHWPHTPAEKAATFAVDADPDRPRHKPAYTGTVTLTCLKRKFVGEQMPTKRDAENAAAEKAFAFLSHYKGK